MLERQGDAECSSLLLLAEAIDVRRALSCFAVSRPFHCFGSDSERFARVKATCSYF